MSREIIYDITDHDGTVVQLTVKQVAARTGISHGTIAKRLGQQGMRSMKRLSESPASVMKRSRAKFNGQSTAHFAEEKRKREAEASRGLRQSYREID